MLSLFISGKPSKWQDLSEIEGNPIVAQFSLATKAYVKGEWIERHFKVYVPKHKLAWAKKRVGEGKYTVLVQADDIAVSSDLEHSFAVRLTEIHDL